MLLSLPHPLCRPARTAALVTAALALAACSHTPAPPAARTAAVAAPAGGGQVQITPYTVTAPAALHIPYEGRQPDARAEFAAGFFPAVGSGLAYQGRDADGSLRFWGVTDRGPNGDSPNAPVPGGAGPGITKMFPAPGFTPSIGEIRVHGGQAEVTRLIPLLGDNAEPIHGRPHRDRAPTEVPLTDALRYDARLAGFGTTGLDPESLVYDAARHAFWVSDEYGPFVARIDARSGAIVTRLAPGTAPGDLPEVLRHRRANRGMEGLALGADGRLHGFLQSPMDPLDDQGRSVRAQEDTDLDGNGKLGLEKVADLARFTRWLVYDPATGQSRLHAYPLDYPVAGKQWHKGRTGSAKLGDVAALPDGRFVVIEQGQEQRPDGQGPVRNFLMLVEVPATASDIRNDGYGLEMNSIDGVTLAVTPAGAKAPVANRPWAAVKPLRKTLLLDLNAAGWTAEKAEGLAWVDTHTLALINDNDFGLRSVLIDAQGREVAGDVGACKLDADGQLVAAKDCPAEARGVRVTRAAAPDAATHLWLIRFDRPLTGYGR